METEEREEDREGLFERLREIEKKVDRLLSGQVKLQADVSFLREQFFPDELGILFGKPRKT